MAAVWEDFFSLVQPHVAGCPEITITAHIQQAATSFCDLSGVWRYSIPDTDTVADTSDYVVTVPSGAEISDILYMFMDDVPMTRVADGYFPFSRRATTGRPTHFSVYQEDSVRLYRTPDGVYTFEGTAILKPSAAATGVEDFIFKSYSQTIASGAISRLALIPGKEWSSPDLASAHHALFHRGVAHARVRDTRQASLSVRPVGFASASRW